MFLYVSIYNTEITTIDSVSLQKIQVKEVCSSNLIVQLKQSYPFLNAVAYKLSYLVSDPASC